MGWEVKNEGRSYNKLYFVIIPISIIAILLIYLFFFKKQILLYFFIIICLSFVFNLFLFLRDTKSHISSKLKTGERVLLEVRGIKYTTRNIGSFKYQYGANILVTNKRILLSFSWFGYMSYFGAMSFYIKRSDYENNKKINNYLIEMLKANKDNLVFVAKSKLPNTTFTLYTKESKRVLNLLKRH
jgi:ABC-type multidrug transport system fused ATPase/permease subunit